MALQWPSVRWDSRQDAHSHTASISTRTHRPT